MGKFCDFEFIQNHGIYAKNWCKKYSNGSKTKKKDLVILDLDYYLMLIL